MNIFAILAPVLGFIMEWIYKFIPNYGWTIILFTLIMKILMFPLQVKQQKSTARMSAFQPMIKEIQEKYKDDRVRMNEEMVKFQQESGFSMTAGCLPMILNMFIIFGMIEVVYRPLQYVLRIPTDIIQKCIEIAKAGGTDAARLASHLAQNELLGLVSANPDAYRSVLSQEQIDAITNFQFTFLGINLAQTPGDAGWLSVAIIIPILSVVTMIAFQIITMKSSGQQLAGSMMAMTWVMSLMFAWFAFTVPVGFSLYYTASNVFSWAQTAILRKKYNPEKIKQEIEEELKAKRAAKKQKKQVTVVEKDGTEVVKDVNQAELDRIRLERARALDEERYKDE